MPEAETLEDKVKEEKPKSSLIAKAANCAYYTAIAAGTTALGIVTVGTTAPIVGAAVAAGTVIGNTIKGDKTLGDIAKNTVKSYSAINAVLYPVMGFGNLTYGLIPNADLVGKAARTLYGMFVHTAVFTGLFKTAGHLIEKKLSPVGLYRSVKDNFLRDYLTFAFAFAPGWALTSNGINAVKVLGYDAPIFALNAFPAVAYSTLYGGKPKEEPKPEPEKQQKQVADPAQMQRLIQQMQQRQTG